MTITFNRGLFIAHSIFDENEKLKKAGFKWDKDKKKWVTEDFRSAENLLSYCDSVAIFQIRFIKEDLQKAVLKSASSEGSGKIPIYHPSNMKPYPYQQAGVEYILPRPAVILADQMGLGKTCQALLTMNMRHPVEALIVCPAILKYNWLKEARKWMIGHITVYIYESKKIRYYESRITNHNKNTIIHIINYDILDKFKDRLLNTPFNFFVADECFVYDTLINTDKGLVKIGDIVENKLDVKILSYNHKTNKTEYKEISRLIKHEKTDKKLLKIKLSNEKELICTEEHKIFVNGKYIKASEIQCGDIMFALWGKINKEEKGEKHSQILFSEVCSISKKDYSKRKETENRNDLSSMLEDIYLQNKSRGKDEEILLNELLCEMENESNRSFGENECFMERQEKIEGNCHKKTQIKSSYGYAFFGEDEKEQSNTKSRNNKKNKGKEYWENISIKRGQRTTNNTSIKTFEGIEFTREPNGISNINERSSFFIPISSELLQSGHSNSRNKIGDRGRWKNAQVEKMEIFGQEKNGNIECVRVESIEILERGDIDKYRNGESQNINLYDLEIKDNHNYFASGVLVSNCHYIKNEESLRTKISQQLARKAKWKILITGTPIYNKPKDLFVPLNLIDPVMFGNFFHFAQRYCGAHKAKIGAKSVMKYSGATNVDELNTILRANYMVRRMAKDVLKDLPDKIKDVIILNEDGLEKIVEKEKQALANSKQEEEKIKAEVEQLRELIKTNQEYEAQYKEKVKAMREIRFKNFGEISRIRKELAIKKAPYVVDFVKEILDNNEDPQGKIVVFGHHTEVLEKIYADLKKYKPVIVTGKIKDTDRQMAISSFSEKNDTRVFIGSMGAAGTGVDGLQNNCNTVVFAELDWTPSLVDQAESRLQRIGQKNSVWVYHIVANDSIDSRIVKLMMEKEAVAKEILDYRPDQLFDKLLQSK